MISASLGLIGAALWRLGRATPRTSYRPQPWTGGDGAIVAGALISALALVIPWPGLDRSSIFFYPYPQLSWPPFHPLLGLALTGLLVPAGLAFLVINSPETGAEYDSV